MARNKHPPPTMAPPRAGHANQSAPFSDAGTLTPVDDPVTTSAEAVAKQHKSIAEADHAAGSSSPAAAASVIAVKEAKEPVGKKQIARKSVFKLETNPGWSSNLLDTYPASLGSPPPAATSSKDPFPPAAPASAEPARRELFPGLVARRRAAEAAAAAGTTSTNAAVSNHEIHDTQPLIKKQTARKSNNSTPPSIIERPLRKRQTARKTSSAEPSCIWKKVDDNNYIRVKPGEEHTTPGEVLPDAPRPRCRQRVVAPEAPAIILSYGPEPKTIPTQHIEKPALLEQVHAYNNEVAAYMKELDAFYEESMTVRAAIKAWEGTVNRLMGIRNGLVEAEEKVCSVANEYLEAKIAAATANGPTSEQLRRAVAALGIPRRD